MAYTTINKSTDYFNTKLYAGTSSTHNVTGVGFQPDFTWIKVRTSTFDHMITDAVRGVNKQFTSNTNAVETTHTNAITSFDSDGFTTTTAGETNESGENFVAWNWLAGTTSGISAGSQTVTPSAYSINTTAGFGMYAYEGDSTPFAPKTISHGLGQKPSLILVKRRNSDKDWAVYHSSVGATKYLELNETDGEQTSNAIWGDTEPTSSVFTVGTSSQTLGNPGDTSIAYVFCEKTGYSKFGSYTGNGSADGTFVYTGFKPAFVIIKRTSSTGNWLMLDNKRVGYNESNYWLEANKSDAENTTANWIDILSNGFKLRLSGTSGNSDGNSYIYMAFAEAPLVGTNNVPCTAR